MLSSSQYFSKNTLTAKDNELLNTENPLSDRKMSANGMGKSHKFKLVGKEDSSRNKL